MKLLSFILGLLLSIPILAQEKLKVGIVLYKTQEKVEVTFQPLMDYVANEMGMEAEIHIVHEDDLAYYLNNGEYDLGIFTVFPYLKEKADFPGLKVFATHHVNGSDHFYGSILVKKNSGIDDLQDLKRKKFLFVKPTSTSGYQYPKGIFSEHSLDIDHGFFGYDFSGGHEESIQALANGEADGIAIDETRFTKVRGIEKNDFKELERFKVPYHAYVASPKMEADKRNKLTKIFAEAHKVPANRALWNNPLGITRWELKNDEYYNLIRRYLRIIRVQPEVGISFTATEKAQEQLNELGDVTTVMERRIRRLLAESNRFSDKLTHTPEFEINIDLAITGDHFSYQVKINNAFVTDGEIYSDSLNTIVPSVTTRSLLKKSIIKTNLLTNGSDWFITYGLNDGINIDDYEFSFLTESGRKIILEKHDIDKVDQLNTFFKSNSDFYRNAAVEITYGRSIKKEDEEDLSDINTFNIFSRRFWRQHYWDKIGLLGGILIALISAIVGRFISQRKKKRFKNILHETNSLIKEYVDGHFKLETKLMEQKDKISQALEKGIINENQFMILKHRIEDMQNIVDIQRNGDVKVVEEDAEEIADIVKDGMVTEKEFSRIMTILSKSKPIN